MKEKYTSDRELVDAFCFMMAKTLLERSQKHGYDVWPTPIFHPAEGNAYIEVPFLEKLIKMLKTLEARGYILKQIARLFIAPSRVAHITYLFPGFRGLNLSIEEKERIAAKILRLMGAFRDDIFCVSGHNRILSPEDIASIINKHIDALECAKYDKELKKVINKISASLFCYSELIYFCHHAFAHEYHGPYQVPDGQVLIKDYFDLRPEIWPFATEFPCEKIRIIALYDGRADIQVDFTGRIKILAPPEALISVCVVGEDGIAMFDKEALIKLLNEMLNIITHGWKYVKSLTKKELLIKYALAYFHILKPLSEPTGISWQPPSSVFDAIKREQIVWRIARDALKLEGLPQDKQMEKLIKLFDPRLPQGEVDAS